jgi:dipeptidyl aminopeptidase/acylaminoacyl peptidase
VPTQSKAVFPSRCPSAGAPVLAQDDEWRTIEVETSEVTEGDVTVSPDGRWLVFNILGHLFRLPVEGGAAEQLTFGPFYDADPVYAPDGARVAFVSDRGGSEGNVFVLELATGQITQVTHERWAARPAWAPDGRTIVYLRVLREALDGQWPRPIPAQVRWVSLEDGETHTLDRPAGQFRSTFYLSDGRLGWTVVEQEPESGETVTRIEALNSDGTASTLRAIDGAVDRVVPTPRGDGLYCRRSLEVTRVWALTFLGLGFYSRSRLSASW